MLHALHAHDIPPDARRPKGLHGRLKRSASQPYRSSPALCVLLACVQRRRRGTRRWSHSLIIIVAHFGHHSCPEGIRYFLVWAGRRNGLSQEAVVQTEGGSVVQVFRFRRALA